MKFWTYVSASATQQDMQLAIYHVPGQLSQYSNHTSHWTTLKSWFHWQEGHEIFLFSKASNPAMVSFQPPVQ